MKKNVLKKTFKVFCLLLLLSDIVYASEPDYSLGGALVLKLIIYMVIILFVLGLAVYFSKFLAKQSQRFAKSKYTKIIDIMNIGANIKLLMVEIGDYVYIIIMTSNAVELIDKIKKDEFTRNNDFEDKLTRHTLSYMNMDKIRKVLNKNYKFNGEEEENEDES